VQNLWRRTLLIFWLSAFFPNQVIKKSQIKPTQPLFSKTNGVLFILFWFWFSSTFSWTLLFHNLMKLKKKAFCQQRNKKIKNKKNLKKKNKNKKSCIPFYSLTLLLFSFFKRAQRIFLLFFSLHLFWLCVILLVPFFQFFCFFHFKFFQNNFLKTNGDEGGSGGKKKLIFFFYQMIKTKIR